MNTVNNMTKCSEHGNEWGMYTVEIDSAVVNIACTYKQLLKLIPAICAKFVFSGTVYISTYELLPAPLVDSYEQGYSYAATKLVEGCSIAHVMQYIESSPKAYSEGVVEAVADFNNRLRGHVDNAN